MTPLRTLAALSLFLVAGCSGVQYVNTAVAGDELMDLWSAFSDSYGDDCDRDFQTIRDFGVRYLACNAAAALPLAVIADRAPVAPFRSGPHMATSQAVVLDLNAGREFGRYNPAFVRWVTDAAVPDNAAARQLVTPIYRDHVARPARLYWLAHNALSAVGFPGTLPPGKLADYQAYLNGGPATEAIAGFEGGDTVSTYDFIDSLPPLVPAGETVVTVNGQALDLVDWPLREEASTGVAFWIRRDADGTADEWRAGLRAMLQAYDANWLAAHPG